MISIEALPQLIPILWHKHEWSGADIAISFAVN